jgi:hypothetical protein
MKYFNVTVKVKREDDKGKIKTFTERQIVDAMSCTEAESRAVAFMSKFPDDFQISSVTESRIVQLLTPLETPEVYAK